MHMEDYGNPDDDIFDEAEKQFKKHYLPHLGDHGARFVRLESPFSVKCGGRVLISL